jgi:alpha-tubulin suppressor-like RCC1 family protein
MDAPLAPGDIARLTFPNSAQDHTVRIVDGVNVYISSTPNGAGDILSVVVPDANGVYHVQGLNIPHSVNFIAAPRDIALTGVELVDLQILQRLDDDSLKAACESNRSVAALCRNEDFWKQRLLEKYGPRALTKPPNLTFRQYYFSFDNVTVAAGLAHTVLLDARGKVHVFGFGAQGQLGLGNNSASNVPTIIPGLPPMRSVAAGGDHTVLLDMQGKVHVFGDNLHGQLGLGNNDNRNIPTIIPGLPPIKRISAGRSHTVLLDTNGRVFAFGWGERGQLGFTLYEDRNVPTPLSGVPLIKDIAAGGVHTVLLDVQGRVHVFGQSGLANTAFGPVSGLPLIKNIAAGGAYTVLLDEQGHVHVFGNGGSGQLGLGDNLNRNVPTRIPNLPTIQTIAAGRRNTILVDVRGKVYVFGSLDDLGAGGNNVPTLIPDLPPIQRVAAGVMHTVLVDEQGYVYVFGNGRAGQLGFGDYANRNVPTLIPGLQI